MTGIFGYFAEDVKEDQVRKLLNGIENEGYHITKKLINQTYVLGKLDVKNSSEVSDSINSEERINIITCGEIFNEDNTSLDDSIRSFYEDGNLNSLKNLNGSFAAAIYDGSKEKLTLLNDRYGLIKLFYLRDEDYFCFAPKIRPLSKIGAKKSLRKESIIDFFLFGYLLGDKTFFKHIYQLPPGSILEISKDDTKLTKYWDYEYNEEYNSRSKEVLMDELATLWQMAVERRIKKDEKIIIPLSGGLDSRAILAAVLRCTSKDNIITFTFGEKGSYDFEIGKMVAAKAGVKSIPLEVEKNDFNKAYDVSMDDIEGLIDATPNFPIRAYAEMRKHGDTLHIGYMGDPIMGSHIKSKMMNKKIHSKGNLSEAKNILYDQHRLNDLEDVKRLFNPSWANVGSFRGSFESTLTEMKRIHNEDMPNYCARWDYKHRQNRLTMFAVFRYKEHFKYSTPFLDNDLINFMLRIPPDFRSNQYLYKNMLFKNYPILFKLPTKTNAGLSLEASNPSLILRKVILFSKLKANKISNFLIRRNIFQDNNRNYIDYDVLLRTNKEYRTYIRRMLEKVKKRAFFNEIYIDEIWRLHMLGKRNYSMLFGLLVTFELFLERFVDA